MKTITLDDATFQKLSDAMTLAGPTPIPTQPPPVPPAANRTIYPVASLTDDDKYYLFKMQYFYRQALAKLPGSHQLPFDLLTDARGRLWTEGNDALKTQINQAINFAGSDHPAEASRFDVNAYMGPLKAIYAALVAAKLAG